MVGMRDVGWVGGRRRGEKEKGYILEVLLYIEPVRHAETKMVAWLWEQCDNRCSR